MAERSDFFATSAVLRFVVGLSVFLAIVQVSLCCAHLDVNESWVFEHVVLL